MKKTDTKPTTQTRADNIIHPPRRRTPTSIQDKAALWLDVYTEAVNSLVDNADSPKQVIEQSTQIHEAAHIMADGVLDAVEKRWPEVPIG